MYPGNYGPAPYARPARRTSGPASVHLAALLMYAIGLLLAGCAALLFVAGRGMLDMPANVPDVARTAMASSMAVLAVLALCWLFVGRRVQRGRGWARVLVLVLSVLSVLGGAWQVYRFGPSATTVSPPVVPVLLIVLLNTRNARSWFRYHTY